LGYLISKPGIRVAKPNRLLRRYTIEYESPKSSGVEDSDTDVEVESGNAISKTFAYGDVVCSNTYQSMIGAAA